MGNRSSKKDFIAQRRSDAADEGKELALNLEYSHKGTEAPSLNPYKICLPAANGLL
jgi:hypothetical protein